MKGTIENQIIFGGKKSLKIRQKLTKIVILVEFCLILEVFRRMTFNRQKIIFGSHIRATGN
jgi:hypothetical protein